MGRRRKQSYSSSITWLRVRRTTGIMKYMVGKATAQEIIQDTIQMRNTPGPAPSARQVATPETRKVMKNDVPKGRANRCKLAGQFFTAVGTICYGCFRRPASARNPP